MSSLLEVVHNGPVSVLNQQHSAPGAPTAEQLDKAPGGPVTPGVSFPGGYVAEDPPGLREKVRCCTLGLKFCLILQYYEKISAIIIQL